MEGELEIGKAQGQMPTRLRKLIGSLGIMAFLAAYVGIAGAVYVRLPSGPLITLAYFAVVGIAWGLPLIPLIRWMNGSPQAR